MNNNKTLVVFSILNITICSLIAYWVPTGIISNSDSPAISSPNVSESLKQTTSLADLHIAIEQNRAMIYQQAAQWEQDRKEFNNNRNQINEIIIELGSRLDHLEGKPPQNTLADQQIAQPSNEEIKQKQELQRLNAWKQQGAQTAMNKAINNSEKIARYIKNNMNISESEYIEVTEIIRLSLIEAAGVINDSPDFKNLEEFNQKIAEINNRKEERIKQALSPEQYQQYQKIGWLGATDNTD